MKILLTGASGFIGSHLVGKLLELEHDVWGLERYVAGRYALGPKRGVKTVFGDLRDGFIINQIVREIQPDITVHLAANTAVSYSFDHPQEVIQTNLAGTVTLAEACLRVPHFSQFVFAGTSEMYGDQDLFPIEEGAPKRPKSPYAVSKVAAELYLQYMREAYGFPVTVIVPFNTYGRRESRHFVVERIVTQMLEGKELRLGDPNPVRDLLYVDDHVNGYLSAVGNPKAIGGTFNLCTGRGVSIAELVEIASKTLGFEGNVVWNTIPARPSDTKILIGTYENAKRVLDWEPKIPLEKGLELTAEWWRGKV